MPLPPVSAYTDDAPVPLLAEGGAQVAAALRPFQGAVLDATAVGRAVPGGSPWPAAIPIGPYAGPGGPDALLGHGHDAVPARPALPVRAARLSRAAPPSPPAHRGPRPRPVTSLPSTPRSHPS